MLREDLKQFNLPDEPGIYQFRKGRKILYVGKATSLRDRVRSYFASDLGAARSPAIVEMVNQSNDLKWIQTDSVLEALILEANQIKKLAPQYNVASKDNKSFNYVVITKERFPRILLVRGRELYLNWNETSIKHLFGPFPQGLTLQEALKIVRKIFPYRDNKCVPCEDQLAKARSVSRVCKPCFNRQIGLCPGVCTGEVTKEEYAKTIKHLCQMLSGNFKGLKRQLVSEMKDASERQDYEKAEVLKHQIAGLSHIKDVSLIKDEHRFAYAGETSRNSRIEAYDVAHTAGSETVAVMTVVSDGMPMKASYRKFKIKTATNDDVAALTEALERRLNHPEWPLPRVFAVDGGKGQMRAAERILSRAGLMVPVVGVVKNERHQPERLIGDKLAIATYEKEILLANNEAHRFAITWHRKRRDGIY